MSKLNTAIMLLKNDRKAFGRAFALRMSQAPVCRILPDRLFLKIVYRLYVGEKLNLKDPRTFNEKLQWLKLNNRLPRYSEMVDKVSAKEYVSGIIGEKYIIPTLGIWDKFEDIDFDSLPKQFVLKCSHDSGSVVICKDKSTFDIMQAKERLNRGLKNDLFWFGREWPYKWLKRRILAEQYMGDKKTGELRDYKFFCFNGKCKCFKIDFDRFIRHRANYFDCDANLMKFGELECLPDFEKEIAMPGEIRQMECLSEKLAAGEPFVRIDFYDVDGHIYFGEMTFFPASGFGPFVPKEWDEKLGDWLNLPEKR